MPGAFFSKRNVLFDLDGTLVDSSPAHARAFVETLAAGHPALAASFDYAKFAGQRTRDVFAALGLISEPGLTELTNRKQLLYRAALERGEIPLFPGAERFVVRMHVEGRRLFLVTGASRISAERILEASKLAGFFSGMITADDVARGKPDPEPYLALLRAYGLDCAESIALEDGEHGWRSARDAGLDVLRVHGESGFPATPHARDFDALTGFFEA